MKIHLHFVYISVRLQKSHRKSTFCWQAKAENVSRIGRKPQTTWALNKYTDQKTRRRETREVRSGKEKVINFIETTITTTALGKHANYIFVKTSNLEACIQPNRYNCTHKFVCTMFKEHTKWGKCVFVFVRCCEYLELFLFFITFNLPILLHRPLSFYLE